MIEVRDLRVDYDQVCAVRDLTLTIGSGEIFGLIGPNGAGKTTTLRTLTGLIEPTYGDIILDGVDIGQNPEAADQVVGFMPDFAPLYDDLTVWEFLDLFAASYNIPKDRRADVIGLYLGLVDLNGKRDALTSSLSRGMKQRLMLAKTLVPEPKVLLLDEPASGMDPHGRALLKDIMRRMRTAGKTVIISSHILSEMADFCTSVGIMERGQLVLSGQVEEVARRVLGQGKVVVEVIAGQDRVEEVLAGSAKVGSVERDGDHFVFPFDGGAVEASELLSKLVASGIGVASFTRKTGDLEDVFLKVGAREVS